MLNEKEKQILARADAATAGPWEWEVPDGSLMILYPGDIWEGRVVLFSARCESCQESHPLEKMENECGRCGFPRNVDSDFIKHSRTDVPYLLDALSRVRGLLKTLRALHVDDGGIPGLWQQIDAELENCE